MGDVYCSDVLVVEEYVYFGDEVIVEVLVECIEGFVEQQHAWSWC